jgi:hypothetical protein
LNLRIREGVEVLDEDDEQFEGHHSLPPILALFVIVMPVKALEARRLWWMIAFLLLAVVVVIVVIVPPSTL